MSKEGNTKKTKTNRYHRRRFAVLPYAFTPIIFVLILMIGFVPTSIVLMNYAVDTVHEAQKVLISDYNDIEAVDDYVENLQSSGSVEAPKLKTSHKIGEIKCEKSGLSTDVYYGINRVSLRNGVALEADGSICGAGSSVNVYGYSSSGFKGLRNLDSGDIISFNTSWGAYRYEVVSSAVLPTAPYTQGEENLILATSDDDKAFSSFNKNKYYVVAKFVSGPVAKEGGYE